MNVVELRELVKNYTVKEIANIKKVPLSSIYYHIKKHKLKTIDIRGNIYTLFDTYTPESCYWAGFIAADGNLFIDKNRGTYRVSIKLGIKDKLHLEKFKNAVGCKHRINITKENDRVYIQIYSKHMTNSIYSNFNIVPAKSLILQPPPNNLPRHLIKHYLRGCFDGDGHTNHKEGTTYCNFNIVSASNRFIKWFSTTLFEFGFIKQLDHIYKKSTCYAIDINNQNSIRILDWIYGGSNKTIRLDRKYNSYCSFKKDIQNTFHKYKELGVRPPSGCKGFDLDYQDISIRYMGGEMVKKLAEEYNVSIWTLLDRFKKMGVRKSNRKDAAFIATQ